MRSENRQNRRKAESDGLNVHVKGSEIDITESVFCEIFAIRIRINGLTVCACADIMATKVAESGVAHRK